MFHGPFGVGKTHLAVGILKAVMRKSGGRGFFFETPELLRQVRHTYNTKVDETEMGILKPVLEADILVLDDLGTEKTSEWVQETLGLVVNSRYNTRRPTIITSNLHDPQDSTDPNSFMFQIGARTRSRLLEMCDWVEIQGSMFGTRIGMRPPRGPVSGRTRLITSRKVACPARAAARPAHGSGPKDGRGGRARVDGGEGGVVGVRSSKLREFRVHSCSVFTSTSRSVRLFAITATSIEACSTRR